MLKSELIANTEIVTPLIAEVGADQAELPTQALEPLPLIKASRQILEELMDENTFSEQLSGPEPLIPEVSGIADSPEEGFDSSTSHDQVLPKTSCSSLNRLALRAQAGDAHAANELFAKCEKITERFINSRGYFMRGGEQSDLQQEALLGVIRAVRLFNPTIADFHTLAELAIKRAVWSAMTQANRDIRGPLNNHETLSLQQPSYSDDGDTSSTLADEITRHRTSIEQQIVDREFLNDQVRPVVDKLTRLERLSLFLFAAGYSYQEIVDQVDENLSTKSIDNALMRAKRKLAPLITAPPEAPAT